MAGIDNNTVLYLRGDSFNDLSLSPKTVTNNGTIISDNGKHYKCIENPKDEQVSIVLEDFQFKGKDNFTIEWWEFLSTSSSKNSTHCIFYNSSNLSKDWEGLMIITWNSQRRIYLSSTGASWDLVKEGIIGEHILNKWVHRAVVRNGNLILSFQNGKKTNEFSIGDKSIYNNGTNKSMLYNAVFDVCSPQRIENLRISNVARYTENFTPPTQPYNSITINKTNQTDTNIEFNIEKLGQETINKVEVLVNGTVSETYSDNYDSVNYLIDTELCVLGNNDITIRVTYDDNYTEELSLNHNVTVDELPLETPLLDTVERVKILTKSKQNEKDTLSSILTSKNVEVSEEDKMSDLIGKVDLLGDAPPPLLYLYKDGDECIDVTGGWHINSAVYGSVTKNSNNMYMKGSTSGGRLTLYTTNSIDCKEYKYLYFEIEGKTINYPSRFGIKSDKSQDIYLSFYEMVAGQTYNKQIVKIDISNIISAPFIFCNVDADGSYCYIYKIWLEK